MDKPHVRVYLDDHPQPIIDQELPTDVSLDTGSLADGPLTTAEPAKPLAMSLVAASKQIITIPTISVHVLTHVASRWSRSEPPGKNFRHH